MKTEKLIYSMNTQMRLTSDDFISQTSEPFGLSRFSSYLKELKESYLLLDTGDLLQGSPLLDYVRKQGKENTVAISF